MYCYVERETKKNYQQSMMTFFGKRISKGYAKLPEFEEGRLTLYFRSFHDIKFVFVFNDN